MQLRFFFLVFIVLWKAGAEDDPSSNLSLSQSIDNDKNRNSTLEAQMATPLSTFFHLGVTHSHYQYDEDVEGNNSSFFVGLQSNPLKDWVFEFQYEYTHVSDLMKISNPSGAIQVFWNDWDMQLKVGYRVIKTQVTSQLQTLLQTSVSQVDDENFWWSLNGGHYLNDSFYIHMAYTQYQYTRNFSVLTREVAPLLGYDLNTINFGSGFVDYIYSLGVTYYLSRLSFSCEYSYVKNEFEESSLKSLVPGAQFQLNSSWAFDFNIGLSRGEAAEEEDTLGRYLSFGATFFW